MNHRDRRECLEQLVFRHGPADSRGVGSGVSVEAEKTTNQVGEALVLARIAVVVEGVDPQQRPRANAERVVDDSRAIRDFKPVSERMRSGTDFAASRTAWKLSLARISSVQ